jgi:hypothetical protein
MSDRDSYESKNQLPLVLSYNSLDRDKEHLEHFTQDTRSSASTTKIGMVYLKSESDVLQNNFRLI